MYSKSNSYISLSFAPIKSATSTNNHNNNNNNNNNQTQNYQTRRNSSQPSSSLPVDNNLPDLSHLSEAEREIILGVLERQRAEEAKYNTNTTSTQQNLPQRFFFYSFLN